MAEETNLSVSTSYILKRIGLVIGCFVFGLLLAVSGGEFVLVLIGAAMIVSGVALAILPFVSGLGGVGPCPFCGAQLETLQPTERNLLCKGCNSYIDAVDKKLLPVPENRITDEPIFGAPTHWTDLRIVLSPTISLSSQDFVTNQLLTGKGDARILNAQWPPGCCVCGESASETGDYARTVVKPARGFDVRDTEIVVAVKNIPYCSQHSNGIKLGSINFSNPEQDTAFAVLFRSLSYRNAFMKLNNWSWDN